MIEDFEELLQKLRDRYDDATGIARKNAESVIRLEKRIAEREAQLVDAHALNREKIAYHTPYHLIEKDNTKLRQDLAERDNIIKALEEIIRERNATVRRLSEQTVDMGKSIVDKTKQIEVLEERTREYQNKMENVRNILR